MEADGAPFHIPAAAHHELRRLKLKVRRAISADVSGGYRTAFRGFGLTFRDLREYQPGDDVRSIQWKASARTGVTYVKTYEEERQLRFRILVDTSGSIGSRLDAGTRAQVLEFAALITVLAQVHGDAVGLTLFSTTIERSLPVRSRRTHTDRILAELLASRPPQGATQLSSVLAAVRLQEKQRAVLFLISDFFAADYAAELKLLSLYHDVVAVSTVARPDALPRAGLLETLDPETGVRRLVDTSSRRARERYAAAHRKHREQLTEICREAGADLLFLDHTPLECLQSFVRQRERRIRG